MVYSNYVMPTHGLHDLQRSQGSTSIYPTVGITQAYGIHVARINFQAIVSSAR